ncbi:MAG: MFS transporter [Actinomycetota bacterium]|nr:MFS transporter [Actinomycetota bacterium]
MPKLSIDITPLRTSKDFRNLFVSGMVTYLGSMISYVAIPFQIADLTGSFFAVGAVGLVQLVPLVVFGLYGGALADTLDRRRIVLITEVVALLLLSVLCLNSLMSDPHLWVIYFVAFVLAANQGIQRPSMNAIIPRVVSHEELPAAGALRMVQYTLGSIIGPAIGGLLIAVAGVGFAYGVDVISYAVSAIFLFRLRSLGPLLEVVEKASIGHILEGVKYAYGRRDLLGTYIIDLIAMIFAFPVAMFPFVAEQFDAPWSLGFLYAATAVGALLVTLTSGWTSRVNRHGRLVVFSAALWGLCIALIGVAPGIWWVLILLVLAGAADMVSGLFRTLIWNQTIPDGVRGRMAGIEMLSYSVGPLLGQVRSSTVASVTSLRFSFASGGLLCVAGVIIAAVLTPTLWKYNVQTDAHAQREREVRGRVEGAS